MLQASKQLLYLGIIATSMLLTACATHSTNTLKPASHQAKATQPAKRYLFLVSSGQAQLNKASSDQYQLTLDLPSINQVVAFTDRPYREAEFISAKQLRDLWSVGQNSFAQDHPNAVLSSKGMAPIIVEVSSAKTTQDRISLLIRPLSQKIKLNSTLHKVTLTIDGTRVIIPGAPGSGCPACL
jgi:hypothetical protein